VPTFPLQPRIELSVRARMCVPVFVRLRVDELCIECGEQCVFVSARACV
jgi:hypothetical protein